METKDLNELRGMVKETIDSLRTLIGELADESIPKEKRFLTWLMLDQLLVQANNGTQDLINRIEKGT